MERCPGRVEAAHAVHAASWWCQCRAEIEPAHGRRVWSPAHDGTEEQLPQCVRAVANVTADEVSRRRSYSRPRQRAPKLLPARALLRRQARSAPILRRPRLSSVLVSQQGARRGPCISRARFSVLGTGNGSSLFAARDHDRAWCDHRGAHALRDHPRHGDGVGAHAMGTGRTPLRRAANCVRSSHSRDRSAHRLSVLSRRRRAHCVGRTALDPKVRCVPQPHLDVDHRHGADPPEPRDGPSDCLGARHAASRLRLLRPRDSRRPRGRMRDVSRPRRPHGDGRAGRSPNNGLVPRLPPRSTPTTSPAHRDHDNGVAASAGPDFSPGSPAGCSLCTCSRSTGWCFRQSTLRE